MDQMEWVYNLLTFTHIIWNRFSLHVIAHMLPIQWLERILGGVGSTVGKRYAIMMY